MMNYLKCSLSPGRNQYHLLLIAAVTNQIDFFYKDIIRFSPLAIHALFHFALTGKGVPTGCTLLQPGNLMTAHCNFLHQGIIFFNNARSSGRNESSLDIFST